MSKIEDSAYLLWFYSNCSNDSFIGSSFIATCQDVPARFVFISDRYLGTAMPTITSWWVIYEPCENQSHNTWRRKNAIFQFARNIHLWLSFSIWVQLLSMVYTLTPTFWIAMNVSILEDCLFIMLNSYVRIYCVSSLVLFGRTHKSKYVMKPCHVSEVFPLDKSIHQGIQCFHALPKNGDEKTTWWGDGW